MDAAVASLPDPVSSSYVQSMAEPLFALPRMVERDPATLRRMALLELQISLEIRGEPTHRTDRWRWCSSPRLCNRQFAVMGCEIESPRGSDGTPCLF
jgi:hypothetical protein